MSSGVKISNLDGQIIQYPVFMPIDPAIRAQLDRIEAMLKLLVPSEDT